MAKANGKKKYKKSDVFRRGKTWTIIYPELQDDGSTYRRWKGGYATEDEAKAAFDIKKTEYDKQKKNVYVENTNTTVRDYLVNWFEGVYVNDICSSTESTYRFTLYDYILPNLDDKLKLIDLKKAYLESLFRTIGKQMPSHAQKAKELFRVCLNTALEDQMVRHNPAARAKVPRYKRKKPVILRREQIGQLLQLAAETDTYLEFLLGLILGMRKGEIYGLKFADIDFQSNILHIKRQVTYVRYFQGTKKSIAIPMETEPKTDSSYRSLHVPKIIMKEILNRKERVEGYKRKSNYEDNDYICGQKNGKPRAGSCLNSALNKLTDKMGIHRMAFHYLRHTTATIMLENGVGIPTIAKVLGHASVKTTFGHYLDVMEEREKMAKVVDDTFGYLYVEDVKEAM